MAPKLREGPTLSRQTGVYYFDETVGFPPQKKRIRFSLRTKDPNAAWVLWKREYKIAWDQYYGISDKCHSAPLRLSELADKFVAYERDFRKTKAAWKIHRARLDLTAEVWDDPFIDEITPDLIAPLEDHLTNGMDHSRSKSTINQYVSSVSAALNFAIDRGMLDGRNPLRGWQPYKIKGERRGYTVEEVARILTAAQRIEDEALPHYDIGRHARRIVELLLLTGRRLGEILGLQWEHVQDDVILYPDTKSGKDVIIPLTAAMQRALDSVGGERKGMVFKRRGKAINSAGVRITRQKIAEYSGIDGFLFHSLRHTAATFMSQEAINRGAGLKDIMEVLGHARIETTLRYLHHDRAKMRTALEALEEKVLKNG